MLTNSPITTYDECLKAVTAARPVVELNAGK
jgi:hypothetical protein